MSVTLSDLTQAFDALGWRYQTVPDHDLLLTSFRTEGGSADLVLRPVAEGQAVLLEAMGLGSQPRERAEMLLALAWRWTGVAIARDPEDGEVRLRLILPVGEASLATAPLRAAVGMLLAAVDAFRQAVAQEDVEDVGAQRAVPDTVEAQRAASDALPAAAQRAMALLEALSQAPDQAAFLREHLDEFDGEVLAALAAMAQTAQKAGETEFAQGMAAVAAAVLDLRLERDPQARAHQEQLQRLLAAEDEANLTLVVEEWPEALGPDVQQLLQGLAEAARKAGQEEMATRAEKACAHLQSLRAARPLDAALADFLDADTWEAGRAVVEANPLLQTQEAVARLGALAEAAQARGEEGANQRYRAHQRHLAQWL
ncbi:MAG: hypothetical protein RML36_07860, partial [Anaerolineae bacterium]|nr:hypothetical protein [Anaerolineae bacterium]